MRAERVHQQAEDAPLHFTIGGAVAALAVAAVGVRGVAMTTLLLAAMVGTGIGWALGRWRRRQLLAKERQIRGILHFSDRDPRQTPDRSDVPPQN
ncbi:MAG: hypothetical protein HZA31_04085 [Opitutae bacterium]|nr:hypothetical protein [Opitutae bacterium]